MKAFLASMLFFACALDAGAVHADPCAKCTALENPRARVLKPVACIPVSFVIEDKGTVVVQIVYDDGRVFTDSKTIEGNEGQFCFGRERFSHLKSIELCDSRHSAKLSAEASGDIERIKNDADRVRKNGFQFCLRGVDWCSSHAPGQ